MTILVFKTQGTIQVFYPSPAALAVMTQEELVDRVVPSGSVYFWTLDNPPKDLDGNWLIPDDWFINTKA